MTISKCWPKTESNLILIDWIYKSLKNPDAIQRNIGSDMIPILVAL